MLKTAPQRKIKIERYHDLLLKNICFMKQCLLSLGITLQYKSNKYSINAPIGVILKSENNYYALADFEPLNP